MHIFKTTFAILLILCLSACSTTPKVVVSAEDKKEIMQEVEVVADEISLYFRQMYKDNAKLLSDKQFDELEKKAEALRKSKEQYVSGRWKLDSFYSSFVEKPGKLGKFNELDYQYNLKLLEEWCAKKPNDVTPKIALAALYQKYAWFARGGGYADTVTKEGWRLMKERNNKALDILNGLRKHPKKDPRLYCQLLLIAKDESFEKDKYAEIFDESVKLFPDYKTSYYVKLLDLQPRWGGDEGEWEAFIKEVADKKGGVEGDKFYAQLVWSVLTVHWYRGDNLFTEFKLDYERVKKGMQAMRAAAPNDIELLSAYCSCAVQAGDYEEAAKLFKELGGRVDKTVWCDEKAFKHWRDTLFN